MPKTSMNTWATLSGIGVFIEDLEFNSTNSTIPELTSVLTLGSGLLAAAQSTGPVDSFACVRCSAMYLPGSDFQDPMRQINAKRSSPVCDEISEAGSVHHINVTGWRLGNSSTGLAWPISLNTRSVNILPPGDHRVVRRRDRLVSVGYKLFVARIEPATG